MTNFIVIFTVFIIIGCVLKKSIVNIVSPLFIFAVSLYFLHVNQYIFFDDIYTYQGWISDDDVQKACFFVFLLVSLIFFSLGYAVYKSEFYSSSGLNLEMNCSSLEYYSIFIGYVGFCIYMSFVMSNGFSNFYSNHFSDVDFSVGAQIYYMRYWVFTSFVLLLNIALYHKLSLFGRFTLLFFVFYILFEAIARQERGSWIRLFSILFISITIFKYKRGDFFSINASALIKQHMKVIILASIAFVITISMVLLRIAKGDFIQLVYIIIDTPELLFAGSGHDIGNEYVTAFNAFFAYNHDPAPDFGLKWLAPIFNFIPRAFWVDKPVWDDFSTSVFEYINMYSPIDAATGSAETGFIDAYYRFFIFSPIFFFILGVICKRFFIKAINGDIYHIVRYICFYIGFVYFLTQNMFPFIVFSVFMYIPVFLFVFFSKVKL